MIHAPSVKCRRLDTTNSATIGPKPRSPNASTASGRPMLPQLLNIIGGTNVRGSWCSSFANGQASSPDPSTMPIEPRISGASPKTSNDFDDSAEKISAGASTFMLMRFTIPMSGCTRRPQK